MTVVPLSAASFPVAQLPAVRRGPEADGPLSDGSSEGR